jgi:quercetin dioxygenase-like cupin family protein
VELDVGQATVLRPGEGERLAPHIRLKLERPELSVNEVTVRGPFEGAGPHFHKEHVDAFYVLEGEVEFTVGTEKVVAGAGTSIAIPPQNVHAFTVPGGARYLNFHAPDSGFIEYLRRRKADEDFAWDSVSVDEPSGPAEAFVAGPGGGEPYRKPNGTITILAETPQISLFDFAVEPGWGPVEPHVHESQVDSFFVVDGELVLEVENEEVTIGPSGYAAAPPGVTHGIRRMEATTRFLNFHAPDDGFADFIRGD